MQQFVIDTKILSIHTEDRDITKWPTPSHFEVELPVDYKNVVSLRLSEIHMPCSNYIFLNSYKNTSFKITYFADKEYTTTVFINEGTYTQLQLAEELEGQLHLLDTYFGLENQFSLFAVVYSFTQMNFTFIHQNNAFSLDFTEEPSEVYNHYTYWGLGYYLGFCKDVYSSTNGVFSSFTDTKVPTGTYFYLSAPHNASVHGEGYFYMELDGYNSMDEIAPFTERSSSLYNSSYSGKHNSAFAKIPLLASANDKFYVGKKAFLSNVFVSDPPLERIKKLKFKFRQHDGRMIEFRNVNFTFTIEITLLRPDSIKPPILINSTNYKIR